MLWMFGRDLESKSTVSREFLVVVSCGLSFFAGLFWSISESIGRSRNQRLHASEHLVRD